MTLFFSPVTKPLAIVGFVAVAAVVTPHPSQGQGRPAQVVVEAVETRTIADTTPVLGQIVARVESTVATRVEGVILSVDAEVGQAVPAGAALARIDTELLEIERRAAAAALVQAEANIRVAEAQLALARQVLERATRLRGSAAFSRGTFEDSQQNVAVAESEVARREAARATAEADLARADYRLERAVIRAPFAGVVIARVGAPGQYVNVGAPVATLIDLSSMEIEIDAPSDLLGGLTEGVSLRFRLGATPREGETALEGVAIVRAVIPQEAATTRTRPVRLTADFSQWPVETAPGAAATVFAPIGAPREALTAPKDALVQSGGGWIVFVAGEDGAAQPRTVRVGQATGDRIEIVSGLSEGDLVVVRGNERLRPGQPITFDAPAG